MGMHRSSESTSASGTTKVITESGELREFAGRVTASQVLIRKDAGGSFVCDGDEMEFDRHVAAVGAAEELRPGGLYFVLPRSMLKRRLQPAEMAALAVRASAALGDGGVAAAFGDGRRGEELPARRVAAAAAATVGGSGTEKRRGRWGGRSRSFTARLSAIAE